MDLENKNNLKEIELLAKNVKILALEAITKAKSGHPGIVLSAANILTTLFLNHLVVDPKNLNMFNRDRFVMDAGHGSALLYSLMTVFGYDSLSVNDLKQFRQLHSKTPGHPESKITKGVEYSTGPLGQGCAASVGMAIIETHLSALYNKYLDNLINHYTYCFISDGAFEEGISYEAFSVAAKYKLNKLIFLYDSNHVQLDGNVNDSTVTNNQQYFTSLGLNYIYVADGFDFLAIDQAITQAKKSNDKPTVIEFNTIIGKDTDYENSNKSHGTALSEEQLLTYKNFQDWHFQNFTVLTAVKNSTIEFKKRGALATAEFNENCKKLYKTNPFVFHNLNKQIGMNFNFNYDNLKTIIQEVNLKPNHSTRELAGIVLQQVMHDNNSFMITNPDLSSSTKIKKNTDGNYDALHLDLVNIPVGVREFEAMAIVNGILAHGAAKGISGGFLVFSDYNKAALRLAALSNLATINFFSHDSIAVGEDGPTHQPVEQINALRMIPNHNVYRPCNIDEMISAIKFAVLNKTTPTSIITSRQEFKNCYSQNMSDIDYGGYIFEDDARVQIILIATGYDVTTALEVKKIIQSKIQLGIRIVSMPSTYIFELQSEEYKAKVLPLSRKYIFTIESGSTAFWYKYTDHPFGVDTFGLSATQNDVVQTLGMTADQIAAKILLILQRMVSDFGKIKENLTK